MTKQYSVADARAHLPTIVDEVELGKEIEITRRGKPVAMVISRAHFARLKSEQPRFGDLYRTFLEHHDIVEIGAEDDTFDIPREVAAGRQVDL